MVSSDICHNYLFMNSILCFMVTSLDISEALFMLEDMNMNFVSSGKSGRFEWIDSVLVMALRRGHWLLISHANFCRYDWCGVQCA